MTEIEEKAETALKSLNKSVREALDRKKCLGQYAVVWHNKKVVRLFEDDCANVRDNETGK